MRKKVIKPDEPSLRFCSGKNWVGDGSKASSPCPFNHSMIVASRQYICYHCTNGTKPSDIIADANGIYLDNAKPVVEDVSVKKNRGRPRKNNKTFVLPTENSSNCVVPKRKRGRPKGSKNKPKQVQVT